MVGAGEAPPENSLPFPSCLKVKVPGGRSGVPAPSAWTPGPSPPFLLSCWLCSWTSLPWTPCQARACLLGRPRSGGRGAERRWGDQQGRGPPSEELTWAEDPVGEEGSWQ